MKYNYLDRLENINFVEQIKREEEKKMKNVVEKTYDDIELTDEVRKFANQYTKQAEINRDICIRKNIDYGNTYIDNYFRYDGSKGNGLAVNFARIEEKANRVFGQIVNGAPLIEGEGIIDDLRDIINYSTMLLMAIKEENDNE